MDKKFIYIHPKLIIDTEMTPCDIYIELVQNQKILKIANKNESLSKETKARLKESNQKVLIEESDLSESFTNITNELKTRVLNLNINDIDAVNKFLTSFESLFVFSFNNKLKLDNYSTLKNLFYNFFIETGVLYSPLYSFSKINDVLHEKALLRTILSLYLAKKICYVKEHALYNINTASFFCDLSLVDNQQLENHHFHSAKLLSMDKNFYSEDAYLGILHHHEYLDGSGLLKLEARRIHDYGILIRLVEDFINANYVFDLHSLESIRKYSKNNIVALRKLILDPSGQ